MSEHSPEAPARSSYIAVLSATLITLLLTITISSETIWTDEAFSAYIASHRTFATCWSTLLAGDSSDLQMALYYLYLHGWSDIFGQSEIALRAANIPFIILYAIVLVWASKRLFRSQWVWLVAAAAPLTFTFCNDTRPYFDVITLSLTCLTSLLIYLDPDVTRVERRWLPWLALSSLFIGAGFHMLMLLLGPPLLVLLAFFYLRLPTRIHGRDWLSPAIVFTPIALAMAGYFAWTFSRGATYDYARPELMSYLSVVFRFAGLSGYSPNRRYDIPFRPFLPAMGLAVAGLLSGISALFLACSKITDRVPFQALAAALATGLIQVLILSFAVHEQLEFRHLSCLLPLLILLIMSGLSVKTSKARPYVIFAGAAIGITWFIGDLRSLSPQYAREDFRSAVNQAINLRNQTGADIAVAADPAASAYYGLQLQGPAPCFPLKDSCQQGFSKVLWPRKAPAEYALFWTPVQINAWLKSHQRSQTPIVLLISRGRHPTLKNSAWWPATTGHPGATIFPFHGFYVYLLRP